MNKTTDHLYTPAVEAFEQNLLGGILINPVSLNDIELTPEHFGSKKHQILYRCMLELDAAGKNVDVIEIGEKLDREGHLDTVGGMLYMVRLMEDTVSAANVVYHSKCVRDRGIRRQLAAACDEIAIGLQSAESAESALDAAQNKLLDLSTGSAKDAVRHAGDYLTDFYIELQRRQQSNGELLGLSTGLADVDATLNGLRPGCLYIVAGRPAMGKSVLGLQITLNVAMQKQAALYVSLEMPINELLTRAVANLARVPLKNVMEGKLLPEEWHWTRDVLRQIKNSPLYLDETPGLSINAFRSRVRTLKKRHDLKLACIDYLSLMRGDKSENRNQEIGSITRALKTLAKELNIPILLLAQLNRGVEQRMDRRPLMSDLRESGEVEQDADVIAMLYRDEVYDAESLDKGCMEFIVRKNRSGESNKTVPLAFAGNMVRVADLEGGLPSWLPENKPQKKSRKFREDD
jgi:replicative DNA helicase